MEIDLAHLGERSAIARIRRMYKYGWPDEDCFYIPFGNKYLLIKTDAVNEYSHIPKDVNPEEIGYFFAAINMSDIASMGGIPKYFMAAMTFPKRTRVSYLEGIERGISKCLRKYGARMAGGDLKEGMEMNLAGVAVGEVERDRIMHRNGMKDGELLCVTGSLGKNASGYYLWKRNGSKSGAKALLDVEPRVREGRFISKAGATSAIDLSDGVYSAIHQLKKINGCGFDIDYSKLPINRSALMVNRSVGVPIEELCLNFGGEYELLFTMPEKSYEKALRLARKKGIKITSIGVVTKGENTLIKDGLRTRITERGYEHFG